MTNEHEDHDDCEGHAHSFIIPVPKEITEMIEKQRQEADQHRTAFVLEKAEFLQSLTAEQLSMLIKLIEGAASDIRTASYLIGECSALIRYVHKADPATGRDPFADFMDSNLPPIPADPHDIDD